MNGDMDEFEQQAASQIEHEFPRSFDLIVEIPFNPSCTSAYRRRSSRKKDVARSRVSKTRLSKTAMCNLKSSLTVVLSSGRLSPDKVYFWDPNNIKPTKS